MFDDIFSTLHKKTDAFLTNVEEIEESVEKLSSLALDAEVDKSEVEVGSGNQEPTSQFESSSPYSTIAIAAYDQGLNAPQSEKSGVEAGRLEPIIPANISSSLALETMEISEQSGNIQGAGAHQLFSPHASKVIVKADEHIESWIERCLRLAEAISCNEVITALTELDVRWQFPGFRLAFVGEFSRGKSTLINRLLERDLLPTGAKPTTGTLVSMLPGTTEQMEVRTPNNGWIARPIEESSWSDLLASEQDKDDQQQLTQVRLTLDHPWLRSIDIELIDTPGAGDLNSNRTALLCDLLSRCDAAVILVSATLPFSMTEATFLEQEVLGRHIPNVLVAVSKLDTVPQEQKAELLEVIRERVMEISTDIPIIPIHALENDASEIDSLKRIRTQIESMVEKGDRKIWRSRKVAGQLGDYLDQMIQLNEAAIKSTQMSIVEKEQALHQIEKERQNAELYWEDIRLNIDQRRLQHSHKLNQKVLQAKEELVEVYSFDLKKAKDLKNWWERDLPFQLRRELLFLGNKLSEHILTQLSQDFEWMKDEVSQRFSRQLVRNGSDQSQAVKIDLHLSQLQLTDIRHYALLTGLASSATTICGFIFGGPAGAVISAAAWVVSDQFINQKTDEQRQRLAQELVHNLDRIADDYCYRMSERLKELYNQLIEEMRQEQKVWQSALESTLRKSVDTQDVTRYEESIEQASVLKQEIHSILSR